MTVYYNEIDPFAAEWLRQLIKTGLIADGEVDDRSIEDVAPNDLRGFTQCHFFAGIGVWSYALRQAGWADDTPVWTGSCPCQPFSTAGKGKGFADERHLWPAFHYLIEQCQPRIIFGEQVASADALLWAESVQADLQSTGYRFGATDRCAAGVGIPQIRQRLFWVADTNNEGSSGFVQPLNINDTQRWEIARRSFDEDALATPVWNGEMQQGADGIFRVPLPGFSSVNYGPSQRVGSVRGYGNAIVWEVAKEFIEDYCLVS